jgi:hypothetical protein
MGILLLLPTDLNKKYGTVNLQIKKCYGGLKFECNAMVSRYGSPKQLDASHYDVFFMYWGCQLKISTALNPRKK